MTVWAEVTNLENKRGWPLGSCLWSPTTNEAGARSYEAMREPLLGELVFHLVSGVESSRPKRRFIFGTSRIGAPLETLSEVPPEAGRWAGRATYYRRRLTDFLPLDHKPALDLVEEELQGEILGELSKRPRLYPYMRYATDPRGFRGKQGIYLAALTETLSAAFYGLSEVSSVQAGAEAAGEWLREFAEGERYQKESALFRRSSALRKHALELHGHSCVACGFSFEAAYGSLGKGFVELHHLDPFVERSATPSTTTVLDVVPLCSNCHRMVHRRRPALTLVELKAKIAKSNA